VGAAPCDVRHERPGQAWKHGRVERPLPCPAASTPRVAPQQTCEPRCRRRRAAVVVAIPTEALPRKI
jgi:hypothetical protein